MGSLKVAVLGAQGVGKSALTVRYLTKRYIGEYRSDSDILYRQKVTVEDEVAELEILDTTASKNSDGGLESTLEWADGFILVYDVTRQASHRYAHDLVSLIQGYRGVNFTSIILMGNKDDLAVYERATTPTKSTVFNIPDQADQSVLPSTNPNSPCGGRNYATTTYDCGFFSHYAVSAAEEPSVVEEAFLILIRQAYIQYVTRKKASSLSRAIGSIFSKRKHTEHSPGSKAVISSVTL